MAFKRSQFSLLRTKIHTKAKTLSPPGYHSLSLPPCPSSDAYPKNASTCCLHFFIILLTLQCPQNLVSGPLSPPKELLSR